MTQQYQEIGDDEVRSFFGGAPAQQQMVQQPLTSAPPARPVAPPASDLKAQKPNMKSMAESVLATQEQMKDRPVAEAKSVADDALNFVTQNWQAFAIPPAVVAGSWLLNKIGGESTGEKKSFADRIFRIGAPKDNLSSPQSTNRVDPVMDTNSPYQKPDIDTSKLDPQWKQILARSEENRISKERELELKRVERQQAAVDRINNVNSAIGNPTPKSPNPIPDVVAATVQPTVSLPEVPTVADIGKQAVGVAPVEAPSTTTQIATEATQKKSTGRPKGSVGLKDTPETWQKLTKEGVVFLPGYGPGDNSLYNTYGAEGRKAILEKYNQGKPLGSNENYKELNKKLRLGVPPSEVPGLMARLPSAEEAGNYGKLGKQMKVGGVLGLGLLASQLANAKSNTEAKQVLGEALLPLGLTPSTLQSGVLPPEIVQQMMAERQKLGSPFRSVPPPQ
jgi:hypothetical protein